WLDVTVTAAANDTWFELRGCGNEDALEQLTVPAGKTVTTRVLVGRGAVCAYASEALGFKVQPVARYRRFTKTAWRTVTPGTVLDTEKGVGFSGTPLAKQALEVDLSKLTGVEGASAVVVRTNAALAGDCGGDLSASPELVL